MLSINSDTQWSSEIESTASRQLSIFVKIARALRLYCRYEGKQKKSTKDEGIQPAVMGRLYGDALQDDYDPTDEVDDEEEFNRNESQDYERALRDAQELDDQDQEEDEEEAVSTSKTTTNSVSKKSSSQISSSQRSSSQRSSSHASMTTASMMTESPRLGSGVKYNYKIYLSWFAN